ncbi:Chorismate mutase I / Prephenate dehydratase [hydrothermal vent metagenome]|uniref:Bifunctional chorismate mutase/prephenate dehydratase n=1 Tax=hydrothermal vent metagenome TaxID=652676 RepID=A0A1W1EEJ0_9ZZZZ
MTLTDLRNKIDALDDKLLQLYNERMELVHKVGELKNTTGAPIYRPEREQAILNRLKENNNGKLTDSAIDALFLEMFAVARNLELPESIAYLGPEASFTHQAAESKFGAMSSYLPVSTIKGVFREVANGKAKFGVIPIENSTNGIVSDTITSLSDYDLKIIAEVVVEIHHVFASTSDKIEDIKKIYSKDIAFGQCQNFLTDFAFYDIEHIPVDSTAKAAKLAVAEPNSAAICSYVAAKLNNLPVLFENIEDKQNNKTRFFIVSNFENEPSGNDKTSMIVRLPNKQGALVGFLTDFDKSGIDLTKIKSHIVDGISIFFIEFNGHESDANVQEIISKHKDSIKVLGSYVKETDDI